MNPFQQKIFEECIKKKSGGLSLPMGSGKTLIGLQLAKLWSPALIVMSKTLVESWRSEIKKFMPDVKYSIFHTDYKNFELSDIVITTPEMLSKFYKHHGLHDKFVNMRIDYHNHLPVQTKEYNVPKEPLLQAGSFLYSKKWGCLLVDEIQGYTNILSTRCEAIASVCAKHRWGLSGTILSEPKVERILGYHLIINDPYFPHTLPAAQLYVRGHTFRGIRSTVVHRDKNDAFIEPKVITHVIEHALDPQEIRIYTSIQRLMKDIRDEWERHKRLGHIEHAREFASYLLVMIPLLPLCSAVVDISDLSCKSELTLRLKTSLDRLGLENYLSQPVVSSRLQEVIKIVDKHSNERLVLFTCFRTNLNIVKGHLSSHARPIFTIEATMNTMKRGQVLQKFEDTSNGILLLTYELGGEGLNLQHCATVLLLDLWWNDGKTKQAIARIVRYGQTAEEVNVYFFTSNTGIEKAVYTKHNDKLNVLQEIQYGAMQSRIAKMSTAEIVRLIQEYDNRHLLRQLQQRS